MQIKENVQHYLQEQIRHRYSTTSILNYKDNEIIHAIFNETEIENLAMKNVLNQQIIMFSKNFASKVDNIKLDPSQIFPPYFKDLQLMKKMKKYGIFPTQKDLKKIRSKHLKLLVVGYGGAMINMLYNMTLWAKYYNTFGIFDKILIFENDNIDLTNLFRIGKPIYNHVIDRGLLTPEIIDLGSDTRTIIDSPSNKMHLINSNSPENYLSREFTIHKVAMYLTKKLAQTAKEKGYIFVGAPDLETRNILSEFPFFFMGHQDSEVELQFAPKDISDLVIENYGKIDVPVLLTNLQLATAAFIKTLAHNNPEDFTNNEILFKYDLNEHISEYNTALKEGK